jgi:hypothetical protein
LLLRPFSFYVKCFTRSSLFAGKMHAVLFRKWKNRVKGRDWYDLEWYVRKGIPLNVGHFLERARDTDDWSDSTISPEEIKELLREKIGSVSIEQVKEDVIRFLPDARVLDIWSPTYFLDLVEKLTFE